MALIYFLQEISKLKLGQLYSEKKNYDKGQYYGPSLILSWQ